MKKNNQKLLNSYKFFAVSLSVIAFLGLLFFSNIKFGVKDINVNFFDNVSENNEIKSAITNLVKKDAKTFYGYLFLDEELLTKFIHDEYEEVESVKISRKLFLNYDILVTKNDKFFSACVPLEYNFLVRCMYGNSQGIFYKGSEENVENLLNIKVNAKALRDSKTNERQESLESLSGTRIYEKEDFRVLKELLGWLDRNAFKVLSVEVYDLKIVDIKTEMYNLKVSLDKGFASTVSDFELISKTGKLQEYINDKQDKIKYIDLSFKDRVFFKLKNNTENVIMSTTTE